MSGFGNSLFCKRGLIGACSLIAIVGAMPAYADNPTISAVSYDGGTDTKPKTPDIHMTTLDVDVTLAGGYAQTQIVASLVTNEGGRIEGDFILDMPEGAIIIGYGLDVNGVLIDGVLIEKAQAKKAFEDRIRRGVDPGLAEATQTNAFKTRVFPFVAGVPRTISLTFISPINTVAPYFLPLETDRALDKFSLRVTSLDGPERPEVALPASAQLQWQHGQSAIGTLALESAELDGVLEIAPQIMPVSTLETGPLGRRFLSVALPVNAGARALRNPDRIQILWDTSLSHENTAEAEQDFLLRVLQAYPDASYGVTVFDTETKALGQIETGQVAETMAELDYTGATDLGALFDGYAEDGGAADICLVFTDGRKTLGDGPTSALPCATYIVSAAEDADKPSLSYMSQNGGGAFIDLTTDTIEAGLGKLAREAPRLENLSIDNTALSDEVVWSHDVNFLRVIAPVADRARRARIEVNGQVTRIDLSTSPSSQGGIISTNWAHGRMAALRAEGADRARLVEMAKAYGVASDETSFLVLERVADYVENDVPLPNIGFNKSERAAYVELLEVKRSSDAQAQYERRDKVLAEWQQVTAWHEQRFRVTEAKLTNPEEPGRTQTVDDQSPPPPPPVSPSPAPEVQETEGYYGGDQDNITVTATRRERAVGDVSALIAIDAEAREESDFADVSGEPARTAANIAETIEIKPWTPDRPYLSEVNALRTDKFLETYYTQREEYGAVPSFYLEMSDAAARTEGDTGLAREIARDIALSALELESANNDTYTAVAERLVSLGYFDDAVWLYTEVTKLEPFRPQPWRNLALALAAQADALEGRLDEKRALYERALAYLDHVIETPWGEWAQGVEVISIMEANKILQQFEAAGGETTLVHESFRALLDVDLRVTVSWNIDAADMDLHILEPTGETAYYGHRLTKTGGRMSNDMTNGYGPEEYLVRNAVSGKYQIKMDYYSSDSANPNGAIVIRANIYRNWGRENEVVKTVDLEFTKDTGEQYLVATVDID